MNDFYPQSLLSLSEINNFIKAVYYRNIFI